MKIDILHRWSLKVLFSAEISDDTEERFRVRAALQIGVSCGANLRGADLCGANLRGADLRGANLCGADLRGANLRGANLCGADLRGADLRGANLCGADLRGANLRGANLRGANLRGANLCGADLRGADLRGANFDVPPATEKQATEALDKVRELILDDEKRLYMGHWHDDDEWKNRTCAEEAFCGTTHCLAGWLQVCSPDKRIKELAPSVAGFLCAPVAAKHFYDSSEEVLQWLRDREYAKTATVAE